MSKETSANAMTETNLFSRRPRNSGQNAFSRRNLPGKGKQKGPNTLVPPKLQLPSGLEARGAATITCYPHQLPSPIETGERWRALAKRLGASDLEVFQVRIDLSGLRLSDERISHGDGNCWAAWRN